MNTELTRFEPSTMKEAMDFAQWAARSPLIPKALQGKPADILLVIMAGRDLGLSSLQSLSSINVIQGKPSASAELVVALCLRRPDICEYFTLVESTSQKATYRCKRKGDPDATNLTYTFQEAQAAGLIGNDTYKRHPAAMLRARCARALARVKFPDLTLGIVSTEEAEEIAQRTGEPNPSTPLPTLPAIVESPKPSTKASRLKEALKRPKIIDVEIDETEEEAEIRAVTSPEPPPLSDCDAPF